MKTVYDVVILADAGIGNAIQALYALEYLIRQGTNSAIFLNHVNKSFQQYLQDSYGQEVILSGIENVACHHLIHGFTYQEEKLPEYQLYYYINADYHSSKHASETVQFMNQVKSLYPGGRESLQLELLKEKHSIRVKDLLSQSKYILYPGGSAINSARRWPWFEKLENRLGSENCLIIGGRDDVNFQMSFVYPKWLTSIIPQAVLNKKAVWQSLFNLGLLKKHAHWNNLSSKSNALIEKLDWPELVALMRRGSNFIGNDGGLTHLAGACGMKGVVLFGPTSAEKNSPINTAIKVIRSAKRCSPCQFGVGGVQMTIRYINCPYQVECMSSISVDRIIEEING